VVEKGAVFLRFDFLDMDPHRGGVVVGRGRVIGAIEAERDTGGRADAGLIFLKLEGGVSARWAQKTGGRSPN